MSRPAVDRAAAAYSCPARLGARRRFPFSHTVDDAEPVRAPPRRQRRAVKRRATKTGVRPGASRLTAALSPTTRQRSSPEVKGSQSRGSPLLGTSPTIDRALSLRAERRRWVSRSHTSLPRWLGRREDFKGVSRANMERLFAIPSDRRESVQVLQIRKILRKLSFFTRFGDRMQLGASRLAQIETVEAGARIYSRGDTAKCFYMVLEGCALLLERGARPRAPCYKVDVQYGALRCRYVGRTAPRNHARVARGVQAVLSMGHLEGSRPLHVHALGVGQAFGLDNHSTKPFDPKPSGFYVANNARDPQRKHDVIALRTTTLVVIDIAALEQVRLAEAAVHGTDTLVDHLTALDCFRGDIKRKELRDIARHAQVREYAMGETIFSEKDEALFTAIVLEGGVSLSKSVIEQHVSQIPVDLYDWKHLRSRVRRKQATGRLSRFSPQLVAPETYFAGGKDAFTYDFTAVCATLYARLLLIPWDAALRETYAGPRFRAIFAGLTARQRGMLRAEQRVSIRDFDRVKAVRVTPVDDTSAQDVVVEFITRFQPIETSITSGWRVKALSAEPIDNAPG